MVRHKNLNWTFVQWFSHQYLLQKLIISLPNVWNAKSTNDQLIIRCAWLNVIKYCKVTWKVVTLVSDDGIFRFPHFLTMFWNNLASNGRKLTYYLKTVVASLGKHSNVVELILVHFIGKKVHYWILLILMSYNYILWFFGRIRFYIIP